jgi:tartrate dehydrogenase/decarboxylase/D-malate dehydrogenase
MLEYLGEEDAANLVMESIAAVLAAGTCRTLDLGGDARTTDVSGALVGALESL